MTEENEYFPYLIQEIIVHDEKLGEISVRVESTRDVFCQLLEKIEVMYFQPSSETDLFPVLFGHKLYRQIFDLTMSSG